MNDWRRVSTSQDAIGTGEFGLTIKYVYPALAAVILAAMLAGSATNGRDTLRWLFGAGVCCASLYLSTGRSTIITGVVAGLVAYHLSRGRPLSRRHFLGGVAVVGGATLFVFVAGGQLIGKTYANNQDLQTVPSVFSEYHLLSSLALPYQYASAPIAALDIQVSASSAVGSVHGCAALSEECRVLRRLGIPVPSVPRVRPFTAPPLIWNTYTALDFPLLDGGLVFFAPIVLTIGLLSGALWRRAQQSRPQAIVGYSLVAAACVNAYSSFSFTAPHLLGAGLLALLALSAGKFAVRADARFGRSGDLRTKKTP